MKPAQLIRKLNEGAADEKLALLYGSDSAVLDRQRQRYIRTVEAFMNIFSERDDVMLFSAPGRSEIGGNHTDHQHGCALGAAVDLDAAASRSYDSNYQQNPLTSMRNKMQ